MTLYVLDARTVTDHFPGIGRYTVNLARAMSLSLMKDERLIMLRDPTRASYWDLTGTEGRQVRVVDVAASPFSLRQQWVLPHLLRRLGADVYHSPYYLMPYWPGVPAVLTLYDLIPIRFPEYSTGRARVLFRLTTSLALRAASRVVAISQATRRDVLSVYPFSTEKLIVIPLAADPGFQPTSSSEVKRVRRTHGLPEEYVLYLGSNKPHKNLVRLVEAWAQIQPQSARLVIAGAWDERYPESQQRAMALGLDSIRFVGPVPEDDLPAVYSGATAFVFPSEYEGFGLPVLEAMASGTPVACSDTSSLPEVAGDAALYFCPTDVEAIAQALERMLTKAELRADLRVRGLAQASRFSWERTAQATVALYARVMGLSIPAQEGAR